MLEIALHNPRQHRQFRHAGGPLTLARAAAAAALWMPVDRSLVDQAAALLEIAVDGDGIALATIDCQAEWQGDSPLGPIGPQRLSVPARFVIGDTRFEITDSNSTNLMTCRPLEKLHCGADQRQSALSGPSPTTLTKWFAALGALNRSTNSLQELYVQAAQAAVKAIGLDGAMLLRRRDNQWEIAASHLPHPDLGIHCDTNALDQLLTSPETLFQRAEAAPDSALRPPPSAQEPPAVVVSPIRNAVGQLSGAIYGYRSVRDGNGRRGIRYLEAHLIELLAGAVSDGNSRLEHEAESERRRVLLEQFAAAGERDPPRIVAKQREVTLLFVDLRRFTELSSSLDMNLTCELLSQVMDCLTAAVMDHDGLVVDYYGDGLSAMWNAPADQADHAELACRAALRMIESLPSVAADWADVLGTDLRLGIGVHTGLVQVGNAGSRRRSKYGPRGANVHLTSRLEKATKEFGVPILITHATASRLSNRLHTQTIGRAQLPGFDDPIEVFTINTPRP